MRRDVRCELERVGVQLTKQVCANPAAVARQLLLVNDEIGVASQVVPPTQRPVTHCRSEESDEEQDGDENELLAERQQDERVSASSKPTRQRLEIPQPTAQSRALRREVSRQPLQQRMMLPPSSSTIVTPGLAGKRAAPAFKPPTAITLPTKRYICTSDGYAAGEGPYAEAEPQPQDAKKRKKQHDAFQAVEPAEGDGPFAYYNAGLRAGQETPIAAVRQERANRAVAGNSSNRDSFRTPFKTPAPPSIANEITVRVSSDLLVAFS